MICDVFIGGFTGSLPIAVVVDDQDAADRLGHGDVKLTRDTYRRLPRRAAGSSSEDSIRACGSPTEYGDRQSGGAHQVQNGGLRSACRF